MRKEIIRQKGMIQVSFTVQFLLSYFLACVVAITFTALYKNLLSDFLLYATSIMIGGIIGTLFTLNIQRNLYIIKQTLDLLANNLTVTSLSLRWRWPLVPMFVCINDLSQRLGKQVQQVSRDFEGKDQLAQQISKVAAQKERDRLARDLHDSIKQQIFGIIISATVGKSRLEEKQGGAVPALDDILHNAQEAQVEMQALLQQLHSAPLENTGLMEVLRTQCQALSYRTEAKVKAELCELPSNESLPLKMQEEIFRIVQEAFSNIARHARASYVELTLLEQNSNFLIKVRDNGKGFVVSDLNNLKTPSGMGLGNIHDRVQALGGTLSIESALGKGTTINICVPLIDVVHASQEKQKRAMQVANLVRKASNALYIGTRSVQCAALFVLINAIVTPLDNQLVTALIILCGLFTLYGYLQTRLNLLQIADIVNDMTVQILFFKCEGYKLLTGIFLLCSVFPGYLYIIEQGWPFQIEIHVISAIICFFTIITLVTFLAWFRSMDRYYCQLSNQELRLKMKQKQRFCISSFLLWLLAVGFAFAFHRLAIIAVFPDQNADIWINDIGLTILVAWFVTTLFSCLHIAR